MTSPVTRLFAKVTQKVKFTLGRSHLGTLIGEVTSQLFSALLTGVIFCLVLEMAFC